jgi:hypothetical protein
VRALLRTGLPPADGEAINDLLGLGAVTARAVDPGDRASRLRALDGYLRWVLAGFDQPRLGEPARLLFGAAPETAGLTLTERRTSAAAAADYEVHHFRKRIEPRICERLAVLLAADSAEATARAVPPRLSRTTRPLRLPADVFAWEAAEHEQALTELWSGVFALRGALLAVARQTSMNGADHPETRTAAERALYRRARLAATADAYRTAYGPQLLGADPDTDPGELAALAGWHPDLDPATLAALAVAAMADAVPHDFPTPLPEPAAAAARRWVGELANACTIPSTR